MVLLRFSAASLIFLIFLVFAWSCTSGASCPGCPDLCFFWFFWLFSRVWLCFCEPSLIFLIFLVFPRSCPLVDLVVCVHVCVYACVWVCICILSYVSAVTLWFFQYFLYAMYCFYQLFLDLGCPVKGSTQRTSSYCVEWTESRDPRGPTIIYVCTFMCM